VTRFVLVRHGRTEWNKDERFRGRADVRLDSLGVAQAKATGDRVAADWQLDAVYSSPLSRALETAAAIAGHQGLVVQLHPGLADIDYGDWQGLTPQEVRERWPDALAAWYSSPREASIPNGETLEEVRRRAMSAVQELGLRHSGDTLVLAAHTVVNRAILLGVLGLGSDRFWRLRQEPCAINVFEWDGSDFDLVSLNDTCHLRGVV
jgi:broad specificity phosphatase PhoE